MQEPADILDSPLQASSSMLPSPPVPPSLPVPPGLQMHPAAWYNLGHQMPAGPSVPPGFHMAPDTEEPIRLQMNPVPPMQSGLQMHRNCPMNLGHQRPGHPLMSPGFQMPPGTLMQPRHQMNPAPPVQPGLQMYPARPRHLGPQVQQGPLVSPGFQMYPDTPVQPRLQLNPPIQPNLQMHRLNPAPQVPPASPVNPGVSPGRSLSPPDPPAVQEPSNGPGRQRLQRTMYTQEQKRELEDHFRTCKNPNYETRKALAEKIGVSEYQVKVWFKNHRAKLSKKLSQEPPEQQRATGSRPKSNDQSSSHKSRVPAAAPACAGSGCPSTSKGHSECPGTSEGHSNSQLSAVPGFSCPDQAVNGPGYSPQEDLPARQVPAAAATGPVPPSGASDPGQPAAIAAASEPVLAEDPTAANTAAPRAAPHAAPTEASAPYYCLDPEAYQQLWNDALQALSLYIDHL